MKTEGFDGLIARVIQHEYDHIEILFTDISSLEKRLNTKKVKKTLPKVKRFKIIE
jgi:peptide deformylase